ncbi:hypothetical protein BDF20DRAFT_834613 [Mycotypha africana]|uniref:uncharacterized protein n=1 Tax=Mycotypha africana TaxID=64632 RepID=UPI0023008052|nr:uncharacterized protein BDF20DRAFT_834613 [Mycotypha africana]KAI8981947.1 hypothetical protein BDF20DRAFT_834613 [Mycotypha africana]
MYLTPNNISTTFIRSRPMVRHTISQFSDDGTTCRVMYRHRSDFDSQISVKEIKDAITQWASMQKSIYKCFLNTKVLIQPIHHKEAVLLDEELSNSILMNHPLPDNFTHIGYFIFVITSILKTFYIWGSMTYWE